MYKYKHIEISVIIAAYNNQKFINRAVSSCLNQSMDYSYEIILVDDGSTDNMVEVAKTTFGDAIKIISLEKNCGLPTACNVGIRNAKGVYVVRVDSDDYINRDMLKIEHSFMLHKRTKFGAISCNYFTVTENGEIIQEVSAVDYPIACGILFNKDYLIDIGLYNESFRIGEDIELRERFCKYYKIYNVDLPLYKYRRHSSNMTGGL